MDFLEVVRQRVVIYDGATGTNLQMRDLGPDDFGGPDLEGCNEHLVFTRPDVVRDLHASFFEVGSDIVETNTFGSFSTVLAEYDLADRAYDMSKRAAELAREVAADYATPDQPRWVAGSIGPGTKLPSLGQIRFTDLRDSYQEQIRGLLDGGVDVLLIETVYDLLQAKAAVVGARRAFTALGRSVPLQIQVTIENTGRMLVGTEIGAALTALDALRPDIIGLNCATGPYEMTEHLRHLSRHSRVPISVLPNAGMPEVRDGLTHYPLTPSELADYHHRFITELGVSVVGGCCGTTPEHLTAVIDRCGDLTPKTREPVHEPGATSIYTAVPFEQDTAFLMIGERTNANGSKRFRDAMLEGDLDTCLQMATDQVKEGAHVLDVCVDYVGRDGAGDMDEMAARFATQVAAPLVIDSTEPPVMEAALRHIGGKAILNSANLEDGEGPGSRFDSVMTLAREYGAAVICLLIDEEGQARDVEWKMRVAHRIHDLAVERYGMDPSDLIFDALTFPLSTGDDDLRRDGIATIEAIGRIKAELAGTHTTLGVSNVSFGLKAAARHVLNSVFLHECVRAGLDSAIVHAGKIVPIARIPDEQREVALDVVWDRRRDGYDPLSKLLEVFEEIEGPAAAAGPSLDSLPLDERLKLRIIDAVKDGLEADLDAALEERSALEIVNDVLLDGMKVVGERFATGEMQLPFVLQSAETMKAAVAHLEPHMERTEDGGKGRVVLATVKGDVHDIGKNLVDIILTNNGYEVFNLGIKVSITDMLDALREHKADAVGMSGLLVKSTLIMRDNLQEMNQVGVAVDVPVLLGGAALTRSYVEGELRDIYDGRLFYGKDAFEGLRTMDRLMELKRGAGLDSDPDFGTVPTLTNVSSAARAAAEARAEGRDTAAEAGAPPRSPEVDTDNPLFTPPFVGTRVVKGIPLDDIAGYVNETALFRNQWQFRPEAGEDDADFKDRIRPTFREQLAKAKADDLLVPQVVYGFLPVNGDGNDLVVWTDESRSAEAARLSFPRQSKAPWLCIADFFRPLEDDGSAVDFAAFHIVTMGARVSEETARLFEANQYQDYLLLHGLSVEMAEALAELWHFRIREEWGFAHEDGPDIAGLFRQQYRGGRYSWGYPACPDLEDNATVLRLLDGERIGLECSEETGWQYQPEQTTSAIICHHPRAKYFVAR